MLTANEPIRVIAILLLAACGVMGQNPPQTEKAGGQEGSASTLPESQAAKTSPWESLPDAPLPGQAPAEAESVHSFAKETNPPASTLSGNGRGMSIEREREAEDLRGRLAYSATPTTKTPGGLVGKILYTPLARPEPGSASASNSVVGRAAFAASRMLVTHDETGKERLNTAYVLAVLTAAAVHMGERPYGARSTSGTFTDFRSTIGGDAGMGVYHEFAPDIRQMVKGISPKFVFKIGAALSGGRVLRNAPAK